MNNQFAPQSPQEQSQQPIINQSQATPTSPKHSAKLPLLILLLVLLFAGALYGIYAWQHKKVNDANAKTASLQSQLSNLQSKVNKLSQTTKLSSASSSQSSDPTATWTSFTSKDGKFSLKYPSSWVLSSSCADNQFNAGPTSSSAGNCNTNTGNNNPEVAIADTNHGCFPPPNGSYSTKQVTVSGTSGKEYISSDAAYLEYCIPSPSVTGLVYEAAYTQQAGYPDISSDFNLLVTKTLSLN